MKKTAAQLLAILLSLCMLLSFTAFAADEAAPGGMGDPGMGAPPDGMMMGDPSMGPPPDGMMMGGAGDTGMSMGGPPAEGATGNAVYRIVDGAFGTENIESDVSLYNLAGTVTESGADGIILEGSSYTLNGIVVSGASSNFTLKNSNIHMGIGGTAVAANDAGGYGIGVENGGFLTIDNSIVTVDGAGGRNGNYAVSNTGSGTVMVVNESSIISTGLDADGLTSAIAEPPSNAGLLISGYTRSNFSIGNTKTYYYNSYCEAQGWAAMSTDSATGSGLDFYSYNSVGKALHGGYGIYSDTGCRDWLYATTLSSAEVGAIISNNGAVHMASGSEVTAEALEFFPEGGEKPAADADRSLVEAGRNGVQIHSPDMMGQGASGGYTATFTASNTDFVTSDELAAEQNLIDWNTAYGPAVGAYIDLIDGADFIVKSTEADIQLTGCTLASKSGVLLMTALNSDSMSRYALATDNMDGKGTTFTMNDMTAEGDILNYDYQRSLNVVLSGATFTGAVKTIDAAAWNALWSDEVKADASCYWILGEKYLTGVQGSNLTVGAGSVWNVKGESTLKTLTVAGGAVNGVITAEYVTDGANGAKVYHNAIVAEGAASVSVTGEAPAVSFKDVAEGEWYCADVYAANALGLISGDPDGSFRPNDSITVAEALKLAACMNQLSAEGAVSLVNGAANWYDTYVAYCAEKGISSKTFASYDAPITRGEFAAIFAAALPADKLAAINTVADGAIPDVKMADENGAAIYALYNAGVLTGNDAQGTFAPASAIVRCEVAAILTRMMDSAARKTVTLAAAAPAAPEAPADGAAPAGVPAMPEGMGDMTDEEILATLGPPPEGAPPDGFGGGSMGPPPAAA